jgi:Bacterial SH3 domain/Chaperone of endosialidase
MNVPMKFAIVLMTITILSQRVLADVVVPIESVDKFVNIRFAPDAASEVVGHLQRGTQLQHLGTIDGWYEVALEGGGKGYVSVDWAKVVSEKELAGGDLEDGPTQLSGAAATESAEESVLAELPSASDPGSQAGSVESTDATEKPAGTEASAAAAEANQSVESAAEPESDASNPDTQAASPVFGPEAPVAEEPVAGAIGEAAVEAAADGAKKIVQTPPAAAETESGAEPETMPEPTPVPAEVPPVPVARTDNIEGSVDYLVKFIAPTEGGTSQIFDNGRNVGIGTAEPQQRLEVNGNIQIHERNSGVAGLLITQSSGDTGYIMHNRANTLTIGAGSVDRITVTRDGNVGFGVNRPAHPLEMESGAHVTAGGVWTNSSSISKKEHVRALTPEEALAALVALEPVRFNYKTDASEEYVGFIAEDVPELVATADRTGLSAMDIVAVLTSVVQQQQKKIEALEARLDREAGGR